MNNFARLAIAAAAVVVAVIAGYNLLPGGSGPGGPSSPTPIVTPTPSPTPAATPQVFGDAPLDPGTAVARVGPNGSISATLTVPEGWESVVEVCARPVIPGSGPPDGMGLCFLEAEGLYSDPCHGTSGGPDIPVGPSADDLATAISEQTAYEASTPTDVTLAGFSGKRLELHLPTDVDTCDDGRFYPWAGSIYAQGPDQLWHVWILDVEGERLIVVADYFAGTSSQDQAELQAVVDSILITP